MKLSGGWGSPKQRARGTWKPKVRWEVLGLQKPRSGSLMTSMEDIRQQALSLANAELKQGTRSPTAERNAKVAPHAPDNRGATLRIKRRADNG